MRTLTFFLFLAFAATLVGSSALAQVDLSSAKTTFESVCSQCHSTDRPLSVSKDRAGWEATVKRMATKTAISEADQAAVIEFLTAKDIFGATCSKCHGTDRPLGKKKDRNGWETTVKRMAGKTTIPEAHQTVIIDYLSTVAGM